MNIDATFWVAVSFILFFGILIYIKVPQKINLSLKEKIEEIKKELNEAEKLKEQTRNLLNEYEDKLNNAKNESDKILDIAKKEGEKIIIENTEKFHKFIENKKKITEQKIDQMKEVAIKDIKNASVKITIDAVENLIKTSVNQSKLDLLYGKNLNEAKNTLKKATI